MTLVHINAQLQETAVKVAKALKHLEYSFNKVERLGNHFCTDDLDTLESFESFNFICLKMVGHSRAQK